MGKCHCLEGLTLLPTHSHPPQLSQLPTPRISASHSEREIATLGWKENPAEANPEIATHIQTTQSLLSGAVQESTSKAQSTNSPFGSSFPGDQTKAACLRNTWKTPPGFCLSLAGRPVPSSRSSTHGRDRLHRGGTAHQTPHEESAPRLPEPGNDRRNFFHAESGSDGGCRAVLATLPPRLCPSAFLFSCGFPGKAQGNGALEPDTEGLNCCCVNAGRARQENERFASTCPVLHRERPLQGLVLPHPPPLRQENGIGFACASQGLPPTLPGIPTADPHTQIQPRAGGSRWPSPGRALPAPPEGQRLSPRSALCPCAPFSEHSPAHTDNSWAGLPQRLLPEQCLPVLPQDVTQGRWWRL